MNRALKEYNLMVIDLTENVFVHTSLPSANHAALRSGFIGYPINPRWGVAKFQAWRTGRQWREALAQGQMMVRSTDSMLVPVTAQQENKENTPTTKNFPFPVWAKQVLNYSHSA
ncbi:MAG: hypothetical protein F6K47_00385 [Symploca sp. SIO2E6]|nr:hypothetical protein [Symploca sp. SIO2E6]